MDRARLLRRQYRGRALARRHRHACVDGRGGARLRFFRTYSPGRASCLSAPLSVAINLLGPRSAPGSPSTSSSSTSCVQSPRALHKCAWELPAREPPPAPAGIGSNNPPSPRPAPSRAGCSCPRTFLPITYPNCLTASGGSRRARFRCLPSTSCSTHKHRPSTRCPSSSSTPRPLDPRGLSRLSCPPRLFACRWVSSPRAPCLSVGPHDFCALDWTT